MKFILDRISLETNREDAVFFLSKLDRFADGSGYRCQLYVSSGSFTYNGNFYFDLPHLQSAVLALGRMEEELSDEAVLKGEWEEDHIKLTVARTGHVIVSGTVFSRGDLQQSLKFMFETDQTVIRPFRDDLEGLLES